MPGFLANTLVYILPFIVVVVVVVTVHEFGHFLAAQLPSKRSLPHASRLPAHTRPATFRAHDSRLLHSPRRLIQLTRDNPLDFEPGSPYAYDNTGNALRGYIFEKVSEQAYADYLRA